VDALFGEGSGLSRVIYALVGLAALYVAVMASSVKAKTNSAM